MARVNNRNNGRRSDNNRPTRDSGAKSSRGKSFERKTTPFKKRTEKQSENSSFDERNDRSSRKSTPFNKGEDRSARTRSNAGDNKKSFSRNVSFKKTDFNRSDNKPFDRRNNNSSFKKRITKNRPRPEKDGLRLNQFIAHAGICSRREADKYIIAGLVSVNDKIITAMGHRVMPTDSVKFNNEKISSEKKVFLLLNKPKGYITTSDDPQKRKTVMELIAGACKERLYPVGRLDRQTTGLLLFTNDGEMAKKLTNPKQNVKKIYHVTLDKNLTAADMRKIDEGVSTEEGRIEVGTISYIKDAPKKEIGLEMYYGKSGIVRALFQHLGYSVSKLDRVYFGGLTKKDIPRGRHRFLTEQDIAMLKMI